MLKRKFTERLEKFLTKETRKILLVNGARQIGKSYLIRHIGKNLFKHFVEINLKADQEGERIFATIRSKEDFYLQLGAIAGDNLGNENDTLVFLDEIQSYPHLLTCPIADPIGANWQHIHRADVSAGLRRILMGDGMR